MTADPPCFRTLLRPIFMERNGETTPAADQSPPPKVDIVMGWDDFRLALFELSHKSYGELQDRQWFKLNPLEIFVMGLDTIIDDSDVIRLINKITIRMVTCKPDILRRHDHLTRSISLLVQLITLPEDKKLPDAVFTKCLVCVCHMYPAICAWDPHEGLRWVALAAYYTTVAEALGIIPEHKLNEMDWRTREAYEKIVTSGVYWANGDASAFQGLSTPISLARFQILVECFKATRHARMEIGDDIQEHWSRWLENELNLYSSLEKIGLPLGDVEVYSQLVNFLYTYLCEPVDEPAIEVEPDNEALSESIPAVEITGDEVFLDTQAIAEPNSPDDISTIKTLTLAEATSEPASPFEPLPPILEPTPATWPLLMFTLVDLPATLLPSIIPDLIHTTRICLAVHSTRVTTHFLRHILPALLSHHTTLPTASAMLSLLATALEHGWAPLAFVCLYLPNLMGPLVGIKLADQPETHVRMMELGELAFQSKQYKKVMKEGFWFLKGLIEKYRPVRKPRRRQKRGDERTALQEEVKIESVGESLVPQMDHTIRTGDTIHSVDDKENMRDSVVNETIETSSIKNEVNGLNEQTEAADIVTTQPFSTNGETSLEEEFKEDDAEDPKNVLEDAEFLSLVVNLLSLGKALLLLDQDLVYTFAVTIPSCLKDSCSLSLVTHIFGVGTAGVVLARCSAFQFFVEIKKLMENVECVEGLSPDEKPQLLNHMLESINNVFESGKPSPDLLSSGLPLILKLGTHNGSNTDMLTDLRDLSDQLLDRFVLDRVHQQSLSLLILNTDFDFFCTQFPAHIIGITRMFRGMIRKARRQDVYALHRVCRPELTHHMYATIVEKLVNERTVNMKRLEAVSTMLSVCFMEQKAFATYTFVEPLVLAILKEFEDNLLMNRISADVVSTATDNILLVSLLRIISDDDEDKSPAPTLLDAINHSPEETHALFTTRLPAEVINDKETVHALGIAVSRIEHLDIAHYKPIKAYAKTILREFLSSQLPLNPMLPPSDRLAHRILHIHSFIASHPNNRSLRTRFIDAGYHSILFENVQLRLQFSDVPLGNAETSYRITLHDCFQNLVLRMLRLARCDTVILANGANVDVAKLFGANDSVNELKSKRALAMRAVDQALRKKEIPELVDAKFDLLAREDEIEASYELQKSMLLVKRDALKNLTVRIETSFFACLSSCPDSIAGCYSPKGSHCERPLEIGFRCDSLLIRILDESDGVAKEIENVETLMTDEGLYVFKAYTNGHIFDTSKIWLTVFRNLLSPPHNTDMQTPYVPAIILPLRFPDPRTFSLILDAGIKPVLMSSVLTVCKDFFTEMASYYDYAPEKIRAGEDVVLLPESLDAVAEAYSSTEGILYETTSNVLNVPPPHLPSPIEDEPLQRKIANPSINPPVKPPTSSTPIRITETTVKDYAAQSRFHNQDLAGRIFTLFVRHHLRRSPVLSAFLPVGHLISTVISDICAYGNVNEAKFAEAFDYERWQRKLPSTTNARERREDTAEAVLDLDRGIVPSEHQIKDEEERFKQLDCKEMAVSFIVQLALSHVSTWIRTVDAEALFFDNRSHFHELMNHLVLLLDNDELQDGKRSVWRHRGGRDGCESVEQFLGFLDSSHKQTGESDNGKDWKSNYAGVVSFRLPISVKHGSISHMKLVDTVTVDDVVGYAIGEFVAEDDLTLYEVVTAWVHNDYRSLRLALSMYLNIMSDTQAFRIDSRRIYFSCDIIKGGIERILHQSPALRLLARGPPQLLNMIVVRREDSYSVTNDKKVEEQFENVVVNPTLINLAMKVDSFLTRWMHARYISGVGITVLGLCALIVLKKERS
ncbi:hypothetical protein BC938DRAFT_473208 [Jimgerdemannia flammicorona]|uniref:Uncharacterized protein n=1 Tax=Jimgerdemannia flammicorona TaxID=994334 RepID=A0A433QZV4_9FUNG|nr:hypothetical protein BC938DRAFT_473208 [Jimgerdemannia flammicorona]